MLRPFSQKHSQHLADVEWLPSQGYLFKLKKNNNRCTQSRLKRCHKPIKEQLIEYSRTHLDTFDTSKRANSVGRQPEIRSQPG